MFAATVHKNVNGHTEVYTFDSIEKYNAFIEENKNLWFGIAPLTGIFKKSCCNTKNSDLSLDTSSCCWAKDYWLAKYEAELKKIARQKEHREFEKKRLWDTIQKLHGYKQKFASENRQDMVDEITEKIKQLQSQQSALHW